MTHREESGDCGAANNREQEYSLSFVNFNQREKLKEIQTCANMQHTLKSRLMLKASEI